MIIKLMTVSFWIFVLVGAYLAHREERDSGVFWKRGYMVSLVFGACFGALNWFFTAFVVLLIVLSIGSFL